MRRRRPKRPPPPVSVRSRQVSPVAGRANPTASPIHGWRRAAGRREDPIVAVADLPLLPPGSVVARDPCSSPDPLPFSFVPSPGGAEQQATVRAEGYRHTTQVFPLKEGCLELTLKDPSRSYQTFTGVLASRGEVPAVGAKRLQGIRLGEPSTAGVPGRLCPGQRTNALPECPWPELAIAAERQGDDRAVVCRARESGTAAGRIVRHSSSASRWAPLSKRFHPAQVVCGPTGGSPPVTAERRQSWLRAGPGRLPPPPGPSLPGGPAGLGALLPPKQQVPATCAKSCHRRLRATTDAVSTPLVPPHELPGRGRRRRVACAPAVVQVASHVGRERSGRPAVAIAVLQGFHHHRSPAPRR